MTRTLITAGLIAAAAIHLGAPTQNAVAYSLIALLVSWYLWPMIRRTPAALRRTRRGLARTRRALRRRRPTPPAPPMPAAPPSGGPSLTQINHHHHYYGDAAPFTAPPDPSLRALPLRGEQQLAHDAVYTTIDADDV
ncbi:MAG: hypothetical protein U0S13_08230 [Mycobacterium sp.]